MLTFIVGGWLAIASGIWLKDMEDNPGPPPGNIVGIVPMAGAVVGLGLAGFGCILGVAGGLHLWGSWASRSAAGSR